MIKIINENGVDFSIVECRPQTGRTHQIRIHLKHLGFPIIDDPIYNPDFFHESSFDNDEIPCIKCGFVYKSNPILSISLHSLYYKIEGLEFISELPEWAK